MFKNSQFFIAFLQQFIEKMAFQPDKRSLIGLKVQYRLMLCSVFRKTGQTAKLCCCIRHAVILRARAADEDDILAIEPDGHARDRAVGACLLKRAQRCVCGIGLLRRLRAHQKLRECLDGLAIRDMQRTAFRAAAFCVVVRDGEEQTAHCRRAPVHFPAQVRA